MYKHKAYKDDDSFHVEIWTDNLSFPEERENVQGEVTKIKSMHSNLSTEPKVYIDKPEKINGASYSRRVELEIDSDESVVFEVGFWMWVKEGEPYNQMVRRFTETYEVSIHNSTSKNISVQHTPKHDSMKPLIKGSADVKTGSLEPFDTLEIFSGSMSPNEQMWLSIGC